MLLGVALGIVTMRFAAGLFANFIRKQPILEPAAYLLVVAIGNELILADLYDFHFNHFVKFAISVSILGLCLLYARFEFLHVFDPLLRWLGVGMGYINGFVNWMFKPVLVMFGLLIAPFRRLFSTESPLTQTPIPQPELSEADPTNLA